MNTRLRNENRNRPWFLAICLFALLLVPALAQGRSARAEEKLVPPDERAVSAQDVLKMVTDNKGKVVMINFFASWCPPCRREIPILLELRNKYSSDDLVIIGISMDEDQSAYARFVDLMQINYPTHRAGGDVAAFFKVSSIPEAFYYGRDGKLSERVVGLQAQQIIEKRLVDLMAKKER